MSNQPTNAKQFIGDLGAGTFANQLGAAISMVAQGAVAHNKKGQIKITLDIARIGDSTQVEIAHTLAYVEPTAKGKRAEDTASKTPMHLNAGGDVTLFANHTSQLFTEDA
ncbi:hypothetical protein P7L54_06825 [Acinetobacter bereziniae]|uniref:hypothetical protein n=1 Tax=Acinetobacter bereziniae TaxID=106648 RepID=UPI002412B14A|nr:hypothetical protein [Acinetobacter bereziniae]MDG3555664.1 hypothetical protein [Acinetobacter bereziniae]